MMDFPAHTHKLARIDGEAAALEKSIITLQSLLGGDHDDAITARISALQTTLAGLTDSRNFYAAKPSTGSTVTAHTLIHNFMNGFSAQAIIFDGVPMTGRAADRVAIQSHANIVMARPDNSPLLDTLAGRTAVTMAQAQGLLYAGFVLGTAIATAAEETLAAHAAQPFAAWEAMRDHFNQSFAVVYVPFISA